MPSAFAIFLFIMFVRDNVQMFYGDVCSRQCSRTAIVLSLQWLSVVEYMRPPLQFLSGEFHSHGWDITEPTYFPPGSYLGSHVCSPPCVFVSGHRQTSSWQNTCTAGLS